MIENHNALFVFILTSSLPAGCAAARPPATVPSTTTASDAPVRAVRLSDAVPLQRLRTTDTSIDLRSRLRISRKSDLYFGQLDTTDDNGDPTATAPIVVARVDGRWMAMGLADKRLPDAEFLFIGSGTAKNEIWTILDNQLAQPAAALLLAHSTDAGHSFTLTTFPKPHGKGAYDSFAM